MLTQAAFHLAEHLPFEWTQWLNRTYTHDLREVAWRRRWRTLRWCWSTGRASAEKLLWPVWSVTRRATNTHNL
jgi:hypothetical protein